MKSLKLKRYKLLAIVIMISQLLSLSAITILLLYKSTSNVAVAFETYADFDAFLYVIDPRSTEGISNVSDSDCMYDDDSATHSQALISKNIQANIPYLIIVTPFDPSAEGGQCIVYFK